MKKLSIFLFSFNLIYYYSCFNLLNYSLIFPFHTIYLNEIENISLYNESFSNNIIRNLYESNIYIKIKLGSPPQEIILPIDANSDDFFIGKPDADFDRNYPKRNGSFYFNKNLSSTFNYQIEKKGETFYSHPHLSNYVQDNIIIMSSDNRKELNISDFKFLLAYQVRESYHGVIGLKGFSNIIRRTDFMTTLKNYNLTNNYIWYLQFNDSKTGNLIIGNYPHDDKYNKQNCNNCILQKKHFEKIYSNITKESWKNQWGLNFKDIFIQNRTKFEKILTDCEKCKKVELNPNLRIIKGSKMYEEIIKNSIFNKYINLDLCFKDTITINKNYEENDYDYYYCNISLNDDLKKEFNSLFFEHQIFKTNFSLDFNDLFFQENEYIFFKIIFDQYYNWIFGAPFLSKYLFIFNSDTKEIGFYSKNILYEDERENNNNNIDKYFIFKIIGITIFSILLILIGIIIGKKLFGPKRKMRMNELEDNFEI